MLGLLHDFSRIGATLALAIETSLVVSGYSWSLSYCILVFLSLISLVNTHQAFKEETALEYLKPFESKGEIGPSHSYGSCDNQNIASGEIKALAKKETFLFHFVISSKLIWLFANTLFCYVGSEVTPEGWVTTFMIQVRQGSHKTVGFAMAVFWGGISGGQFVLGFVAGRSKGREQLVTFCYFLFPVLLFATFAIASTVSLSTVYCPSRIFHRPHIQRLWWCFCRRFLNVSIFWN